MILTFNEYLNESVYTNTKGGNFWGDTGAGILPICTKTKRILLCLRSKHVNEPNTWGIIGGKIDNDENPEVAAKRELREETSYAGNIKMIEAFKYVSSDGHFTYHNFIGLVDEEFEVYCDWENERGQWLSYDELLKINPKHFGLTSLIKNSKKIILKYV